MPWEPQHNFAGSKRVRENLKTFALANFADALKWAQGQCAWEGDDLPPVLDVYGSRAVRARYPVLNLLLTEGNPKETADGDYDEQKKILLEVETTAEDADNLFDALEVYNLAVRSMATEIPADVLFAGVESEARGDFRWVVDGERYGERRYESEAQYVQVGSQILTYSYAEDKRDGD